MIRRFALWWANRVMAGEKLQIRERNMPIFTGSINHVEERRDMGGRLILYALATNDQRDTRTVPIMDLTRCRVLKAWIYRQ